MKIFQKRAVAAVVLVLAIVAGVAIGQAKKPDTGGEASTAIVGTYTYVYDHAGVLSDSTMEHIDAMNTSLFAQTGAQILVVTVDSTDGEDIIDYAADLGNTYGVGSAERNNGVVMVLALDNISQGGLVGDYCVVVGTGLERYEDDFASLQSYYLEMILPQETMTPAWRHPLTPSSTGLPITTRHHPGGIYPRSAGDLFQRQRYYTETRGYVAPAIGSLVSGVVVLLVVLFTVGDPGRHPLQTLPPAVPAARHGAAHSAVLPHLLGTAPASKTPAAAQAAPPSAHRRHIRRRILRRGLVRRRFPGRDVQRRQLRRCRRPAGILRRRCLSGRRRPSRRLRRRFFPRRRRPAGRRLPWRPAVSPSK